MQIKFKSEYINNLTNNIIINSDSYKQFHSCAIPTNINNVYEYTEARMNAKNDKIIFFGLQSFIKQYLLTPITQFMIDQAEWFVTNHGLTFNREGWQHILDVYNGYLPVIISAPPEGTSIPKGCPYMIVENSNKDDPMTAWVPGWMETQLMRLWAPIAVATQSKSMYDMMLKYYEETGNPENIKFGLIDFSARGVSSKESSEILSAAHLASGFMGSDGLLGIAHAMQYYNETELQGFSCKATEHSISTMGGKEGELDFYLNLVDKFFGPGELVSVVMDTYDLTNALDMLGTKIKPYLLAKGGTWKCRPDSGVPLEQAVLTVTKLDHYFGHTINDKGYKVLHPSVSIIIGDGVNYNSVKEILEKFKELGYSADNINFGSGGWLAQSLTRDTNATACKASYIEVDGIGKDIRKECATDPKKSSKAGKVTTVIRDGNKICVKENEIIDTDINLLHPVYDTGKLLVDGKFSDIRSRCVSNN